VRALTPPPHELGLYPVRPRRGQQDRGSQADHPAVDRGAARRRTGRRRASLAGVLARLAHRTRTDHPDPTRYALYGVLRTRALGTERTLSELSDALPVHEQLARWQPHLWRSLGISHGLRGRLHDPLPDQAAFHRRVVRSAGKVQVRPRLLVPA